MKKIAYTILLAGLASVFIARAQTNAAAPGQPVDNTNTAVAAAAAAGPVGRTASAQTDAFMSAEILSWSRSKGLFAGASIDGATLRNDLDENQLLYGQRWTSKQILGSGAKVPEMASKLVAVLNKYSMREKK